MHYWSYAAWLCPTVLLQEAEQRAWLLPSRNILSHFCTEVFPSRLNVEEAVSSPVVSQL